MRERRLTDIDLALARHLCDRLVGQLSLIWTDMAEIELGVVGLESHMETAQMVPVSEPTLTLTMEARLDGISSTLALLLPWSAIAPVAERFGAHDDAPDRGEQEIQRVRRALGGVDVTVRAEVAAVELPIEAGARPAPRRRAAPRGARRGGRDAVRRPGARPAGEAGTQRQPSRRADHRAGGTVVSDDALIRLGRSTLEAITGVLEMLAPGAGRPGAR